MIVDIAVNAAPSLPVVSIVRTDLRLLGVGDIVPGMIVALVFDGTRFQMISMPASNSKVMTAPLEFFVNSNTGNDANDGLTPATAFRTIQRAMNEMVTWTNVGFEFKITCADGTYERANGPPINGSGYVLIQGNNSNPSACVIYDNVGSRSDTHAIVLGNRYSLRGFKIQSNSGGGIVCAGNNTANCGNIEFGYCPSTHVLVFSAAEMGFIAGTNIIISGSSGKHVQVDSNSLVSTGPVPYGPAGAQLVIANSVSISTFAAVGPGCIYTPLYSSIANPHLVSGSKFSIGPGGMIDSQGRGVNWLPGSAGGYIAPGGTYL
jgi:hypothetical protein